jgi:hypothetical protein
MTSPIQRVTLTTEGARFCVWWPDDKPCPLFIASFPTAAARAQYLAEHPTWKVEQETRSRA